MRIAYYVNSLNSVNWGGQATSAAIRELVEKRHPEAEFVPMHFGKLPLKNAVMLRRLLDRLIVVCVERGWLRLLMSLLSYYGIPKSLFSAFDTVCFNGEGAIHDRSGHVFKLIASLYVFKQMGSRVFIVSQSVDVSSNGLAARLIRQVYPLLDRVDVREPASQKMLERIGVSSRVVCDPTYGLARQSASRLAEVRQQYALPDHFVCITASSSLTRSAASVDLVRPVLERLVATGRPVIFMAATKTDEYIAQQLQPHLDFRLISYKDCRYEDAIAIIACSELIVGGRQHPNIFAIKYGVPFIGFRGNTHKMEGVAERLNYPLPILDWQDIDAFNIQLEKFLAGAVDLSKVTVPDLPYIALTESAL